MRRSLRKTTLKRKRRRQRRRRCAPDYLLEVIRSKNLPASCSCLAFRLVTVMTLAWALLLLVSLPLDCSCQFKHSGCMSSIRRSSI